MPYLIAIFVMPMVGHAIDKIGMRMTCIFLSNMLGFVAHSINLMHGECDRCWTSVIPFCIIGIQVSSYNVVQYGNFIPILIKPKSHGTAFGILTCCQNIGTTIFPFLIGKIKDRYGFFWVDVALLITCSIITCLRVTLFFWDRKKRGSILQSKTASSKFEAYLKGKAKKNF